MMIQFTVLLRLSSRYMQQPALRFSSCDPSQKPSMLFGEDFYTVGSVFYSCARRFSFYSDMGASSFDERVLPLVPKFEKVGGGSRRPVSLGEVMARARRAQCHRSDRRAR